MNTRHWFWYGVSVIALMIIILAFQPVELPLSAVSKNSQITEMGDIVLSGYRTFGFVEGKDCYVDDNRVAGCISGDTQSIRYFGELGWSEYGSCAGMMEYWGCDYTDCALQNGGECTGSPSDSDHIQCSYDSDCEDNQICSQGTCVSYTPDPCTTNYECISGSIFSCNNGELSFAGNCWNVYGVSECEESKGDDYRDLCKRECDSDTDCQSGYACLEGDCVTQEKKDRYDEIKEREKELTEEKQQCLEDNGIWTGTDCIETEEQEVTVEEFREQNNVEPQSSCTQDFIITCSDGTEIVDMECIDGELQLTGNQCPDNTAVTHKPTGLKGLWHESTAFVILIISLIGAGIIFFILMRYDVFEL